MPLVNYHTHTWRCGHAEGEVIDYAREAEAAGMTVLGMSDHVPLLDPPDERFARVRMRLDQLEEYFAAIDEARAAYPNLTILTGLECDWDPAWRDDFAALAARPEVDYLIGATHWPPVAGERIDMGSMIGHARLAAYTAHLVEMMESGLFAFVAHPDMIGAAGQAWDEYYAGWAREVCRASVRLGVPLEINGYGLRKTDVHTEAGPRDKYPWPPFWRIAAEEGARVVLSSDAHRPEDVAASLPEVAALADALGLRRADFSHLHPLCAEGR